MLEVIKYLNSVHRYDPKAALEQLKEELGIKYTLDERFPELVVLNYCQIDSPKHHPITLECRSLVLSLPEYDFGIPAPAIEEPWKLVSRSFDRFFNRGETEATYLMEHMIAHEKMDGSLIGVFFFEKYGWMYRTRSMIMPTSTIMGFELTWKDLIEDALGEEWAKRSVASSMIEPRVCRHTYILEVTSPENRIVTRYKGRQMTLLAIRKHDCGSYFKNENCDALAEAFGWNRPERYTFGSMKECAEAAKDLRELKEGYVVFDRHNEPAFKEKNPAYVAAHHLRGEGVLTPRRVMDLLIMNEVDEYLSIFPEDEDAIAPYVQAYKDIWMHATDLWTLNGDIMDQKEFALEVKDTPVATLLFRRKAGIPFNDAFNAMTNNGKYAMITKYLEKK